MAPHSSTFAWKIPWMEGPGGLQSMGSLRVWHNWATSLSLPCIGEGNGNPLQCSCLENPRDGGAQWTAVCGVAQSWTWLKRLSSSSSSSSGLYTIRTFFFSPRYGDTIRFLTRSKSFLNIDLNFLSFIWMCFLIKNLLQILQMLQFLLSSPLLKSTAVLWKTIVL